MAKFDTSQYASIFEKTGKTLRNEILANPKLIQANHTFWKENFIIAPAPEPSQADGTATFKSTCRQLENGYLMDLRAPLSDSITRQQGNEAFYTGVIPGFIARGWTETALEREYKVKLFDQIKDEQLIASYIIPWYQESLDSANMTLSNMAAQLMSKGFIKYDYGFGPHANLLKADIPTENFLKAGQVAWSDTQNCLLLDQWRDLVKKLNKKLGVKFDWLLQITEEQFENYVMKNKQVLDHVRYINNINGILMPQDERVTDDMVKDALKKYKYIPTISIVSESQTDEEKGTVSGWKPENAVLRPMGRAGVIRWSIVLDEIMSRKYGSSVQQAVFSKAMNNIATIRHTTINNGEYKEWHMDMMMNAIPTLDEFLYHFIIDTTVADA